MLFVSVANVEDTRRTQGQEPGGRGEGGKTRDNWVLKVKRSAVKGKDMGKPYLEGKADPGLASAVLWGGCTPAATELEHPKPSQCRACGMGTRGHSPKSGWEMAGNALGGALLPTGDFPSTTGTATGSLSEKAGARLCSSCCPQRALPGARGKRGERGAGGRLVLEKYNGEKHSETQHCCWIVCILLIRDGEEWRRDGSG